MLDSVEKVDINCNQKDGQGSQLLVSLFPRLLRQQQWEKNVAGQDGWNNIGGDSKQEVEAEGFLHEI